MGGIRRARTLVGRVGGRALKGVDTLRQLCRVQLLLGRNHLLGCHDLCQAVTWQDVAAVDTLRIGLECQYAG